MNIENKLKEIGEYFCNKIIEGEYKFITCSEHTAKILIDEKYNFELWIANTPKDNFNFYETFISFNNEYLYLKTQKERIAAWSKMKPHITKYKNTALKREKQKQLNRLQKELAELKSKN